jgi:molybdopterin molybdotransferase
MISVQEATTIIQNHLGNFETETIPLSECVGRVLREDILADMPFPSFDRVMMDGIAINSEGWNSGVRTFPIQEMQPAGVPKVSLNNKHHCIEVMTGAVLPDHTDVVIPYEEIDIKNHEATISLASVTAWKNIHRTSSDRQMSDLLLSQNIMISPAEIATLAAVGKSEVIVLKQPKVAVISTGDELVEVNETPASHQIRKSNSYALKASLEEMKISASLIHLPDERQEVIDQLSTLTAKYDVIILSGGVSKGKKDHIPEALEMVGVEKHFHRVKQRPGKPFWFGTKGNTTIFALPGNPVATFLCFYRYVKPWLMASMKVNNTANQPMALLTADYEFTAPLTYFLQVNTSHKDGMLLATPIAGKGSGDFTNLNQADGFLELPESQSKFKAGEIYQYISFR